MRSGVRVADVRSQAHVIEITDGSSGRRTVVGVHLVVGAFGGGRHWVLKLRHDMCGGLACGRYDECTTSGRDRGGRCVR